MIRCPNCGVPCRDDDDYCGNCGMTLRQKKRKTSAAILGICVGIAVLMIAVTLVIIWQLDKKSDGDSTAEVKKSESTAEAVEAEPTKAEITVTPEATPEPTVTVTEALPEATAEPTVTVTEALPEVTQAPLAQPVTQYATYYVVNCRENISLRTAPSTSASRYCMIPLGAAVSVIGAVENGFYQVIYNGQTGYALAAYLSTTPPASMPSTSTTSGYETYYVVNCKENISLRTAPSTSASRYCMIPLGEAVSYVAPAENGFYQVIYNGQMGYALASYLSPWPQAVSSIRYMTVVNCNESITLRRIPSTSGDEICQMPLGASVIFEATADNGFYMVSYNGITGYALASYLAG